MKDDIKKIVAAYNDAKKVFETVLKEKSGELFIQFFKDNPEFRSLEWKQYTPSFNDGDPCRFTRGDIYYTLQPEYYANEHVRNAIEEGDYDIDDLDEGDPLYVPSDWERNYKTKYKSEYYDERIRTYDGLPQEKRDNIERLSKIYQEMITLIESIPDDVAEDIFGNGTKIRVTAKGIEKEDYYHDY